MFTISEGIKKFVVTANVLNPVISKYWTLSLKNNHLRDLRGLRTDGNITHLDLAENKIHEGCDLGIDLTHIIHLDLSNIRITSELLQVSFNFSLILPIIISHRWTT